MPTGSHSDAYNILIISDLHLGDDIKPQTKTGYLRHVIAFERELESFLLHYTDQRLNDRPWRLIVNGDMVDFLGICLLPQEGEVGPEGAPDVTPEDHVYGLGTQPRAARAKMRRVLERHDGVFRALAEFVGAGNRCDIIVGNHDVEFHWPIVQETFKRGVAALYAGARPREEIEAAITFHPWFYFEENVAWVEHGHQYDDYCSFDYVLNPVSPANEEIVLNVGAAGMRYVANQHGYIEGQEAWGFAEYVRWSFAQGVRGVLRIGQGFWMMCIRMLTLWRVFAREPDRVEARRSGHLERLRQVAEQFRLAEETLLAVDALRRKPVVSNLFMLLMALMLDRLLLVAVTTLLVLVFVLALPWSWALAAVAGALTIAGLTNVALARRREEVDPEAKLRQVPERIRRHVRAPFVVFGHTHGPMAVPLSDGGMYFNTGTWVPGERPGILNAFTHLLIRHDETGPRAALCQWRDGESREFTPAPVATTKRR